MRWALALVLSLLPAIAAPQVSSWFFKALGVEATPERLIDEPGTGRARWLWIYNASTKAWDPIINVELEAYADYGGLTADRARAVISAASSPIDGIRQAQAALSIPPQGPQEVHDFKRLRYLACKQLVANPPPRVTSVPDTCVAPPPLAAPAWVVGPATRVDGTRPAYRYANGVRGAQVTPGAVSGGACDVSTQFETTSAGTWGRFAPAFDPTVGTLCVRAP